MSRALDASTFGGILLDMYYVTPDGEIRCETLRQALDVARAIRSGNGKATVPRPPAAASASKVRELRRPYDNALSILMAIKEAESAGIGGVALSKKVGLKNQKGIGTTLQNTRRFLRELGLDFDKVAERKRIRDLKVWFALPDVDKAIKAIKARIAEMFPS